MLSSGESLILSRLVLQKAHHLELRPKNCCWNYVNVMERERGRRNFKNAWNEKLWKLWKNTLVTQSEEKLYIFVKKHHTTQRDPENGLRGGFHLNNKISKMNKCKLWLLKPATSFTLTIYLPYDSFIRFWNCNNVIINNIRKKNYSRTCLFMGNNLSTCTGF